MSDQVAINYLHTFLDRQQTRSYKKGEIIVFQGEAPRSAYVIKTGTIKAYNLSVEGDEKPISFYDADTAFPASWIYGKSASSLYYYEAFTQEVELYILDRQDYVDFIKKRPALMYQELERFLIDQLAGSIRLNALQHSKASDKLIYTLHYLARTHGRKLDDHSIEITLDLKHQDFANLTGITRETAATELNKLKKIKVINYSKSTPYVLNTKRLMQIMNDQYIADLEPTKLS